MKKTITILAACMLVFSFAGMAAAQQSVFDAVNCGGDAGNINRGCATEQTNCSAFDFDAPYTDSGETVGYGTGYCDKRNNRAVFPICDCITNGIFENIVYDQENMVGDQFEIGMKILVDKHDGNGRVEGNNGVYWAQSLNDMGGIAVHTYTSQQLACTDYDNSEAITNGWFMPQTEDGGFEYLLASGTTISTASGLPAEPLTGNVCQVPEQNQVVEFRSDDAWYEITYDDDEENASNWVIDIPSMRVDPTKVQGGWDVYVEVCIYETGGAGDGICSECENCCFQLNVGQLCCPGEVAAGCSDTLIFPYLGKTDGAWWNGIAVTNLSDEEGEATVSLYEGGDVYTGTVTIAANSSEVVDVTALSLTTEGGDGVLGNERSYVKVVTDGFAASGFAMMAKEANGVSMGYLPVEADCSNCKVLCE